VHPCKIYNILRLEIPFLFIGPQTSHVGDLMKRADCHDFPGGILPHGDVEGVTAFLESAVENRTTRGSSGRQFMDSQGQDTLLPRFLSVVLDGLGGSPVEAVGTKAASETEGCPQLTCP
jgi:hypothetical protein